MVRVAGKEGALEVGGHELEQRVGWIITTLGGAFMVSCML